ncbi:MAG: nucleoside-diphosphate kinase [Verrucomicrobiae bacterium]|nr:nucleoside-diphosphate kinase [Verrucomicrobiae bacterium]
MAEQLSYVLITPYTLAKSRTGGIISRLLARTGCELVAARMFAPTEKLIKEYAETIVISDDPWERKVQELIREYVLTKMSPDHRTGARRRVMMLLFKGEDAVRKVREVVGFFYKDRYSGETIRDTYGDFVFDDDGELVYFEPAILAPPSTKNIEEKLKIWAKYSETDGGILEGVVKYPNGVVPQKTLVIIKPDNFRFPSGRPGNVMDYFSRTGLFIIAIKVHHMSVSEALEFYAPVREILRTKLLEPAQLKAKAAIEKEMGIKLPAEIESKIGEMLSPLYGDAQFNNIVKFMSGYKPEELPQEKWKEPGTEKCIVLVYEGVDAIKKIRDVLGPTDPSKAPPGSIRREFGSTIMTNAAHASDAPESVIREMKIVKPSENNFKKIIENFLKQTSTPHKPTQKEVTITS